MKLICATFLAATAALAADVSGTWKFSGDVAGNPIDEACTMKQDGNKLSGSCTGRNGKVEATGDVDGQKMVIKHPGEYEGTKFTVTYSGTIAADGSWKGTVDVDAFGVSGDATAKKTE